MVGQARRLGHRLDKRVVEGYSHVADEVEANSADRTLAEHEAIYAALADGDANLAQAAALVHISTTERWLRRVHGAGRRTADSAEETDALPATGT